MEKEERLAAIRAAFKAKAGRMAYVPSGKPAKVAERVTGRMRFGGWGLATSHRWGRTEWLETADPKPKRTVSTLHRQGVPALMAVAAKAPKKLIRTHADAEAFAASRKRQ